MESQAGRFNAQAALSRKVVSSSSSGVARSSDTSPAKIATKAAIMHDTASISRRGSTMSARAPAGSVNRNIGRFVAACTSDTLNGLMSSVVISQPDAVSYIAIPIREIVLAAQTTTKPGWAKAPSQFFWRGGMVCRVD